MSVYAEVTVECMVCGRTYAVGVICGEESAAACPVCGPGKPVTIHGPGDLDLIAPHEPRASGEEKR